jgi:hypothetical protein
MNPSAFVRTVLASVVVLGVAIAGAVAADESKPPQKPKPKPKDAATSPILEAAKEAAARDEAEPAEVFTNDDLERMMSNLPPEKQAQGVYQAPAPGTPAENAAAPAGETPPANPEAEISSLDWLEQQREGKTAREDALRAARERVTGLEAKVAELERRALAIKNPFLARPEKPKSEDGQEVEWDNLDSRERVAVTEHELVQVRKDLDQARNDLAQLERAR